MYEKDATAQQASLWGLSLEEIPPEVIDVWDINWDSFNLFCSLSTQWRTGASGATGMDYGIIPAVGDMLGYKKKKVRDMFPDIQVMENEALITMGENNEDANDSGTTG